MNDPTDDKIQQLVSAVLEAVDARLEGIRHDMAQFAADVDDRHHQVLATIAALERRIDSLSAHAAVPTTPAAERSPKELSERMEQATKMLIDRIETAQRASMATTNQRLTQLDDRIDQLRALANLRPDAEEIASLNGVSSVPPAFVPSADESAAAVEHPTDQLPHLANADLAEISRPLIAHGHITTQVPIVLDHSGLRQMTAPPMPPLVTPHVGDGSAPTIAAAPAPVAAQEEEIDISRLTSLLNEKLGHLSLPPRPE